MIALKPALGFADRPGLAIPSGLSSHEPEVALRRRWTRTPRDPVTAGSSHLERVPNTTRAHAEPGRGSQLNLEGPRGLLWTLVASSPKREKYLRTFLSKVCTGAERDTVASAASILATPIIATKTGRLKFPSMPNYLSQTVFDMSLHRYASSRVDVAFIASVLACFPQWKEGPRRFRPRVNDQFHPPPPPPSFHPPPPPPPP